MNVKINAFVSNENLTEQEAIFQALNMVVLKDAQNELSDKDVVTKLYFIAPKLGKILVVVNNADRDALGVTSNILANTNIADYPLERLPAQIIDYSELIIKLGTHMSGESILNIAQSMAEKSALRIMPFKIPVVKVINYNTDIQDFLVLPSAFGANIFTNLSGIVNNGDSAIGDFIIENGGKTPEQVEVERLETERIEAERLALIEAERLEAQRIEAERLEAERLELEKNKLILLASASRTNWNYAFKNSSFTWGIEKTIVVPPSSGIYSFNCTHEHYWGGATGTMNPFNRLSAFINGVYFQGAIVRSGTNFSVSLDTDTRKINLGGASFSFAQSDVYTVKIVSEQPYAVNNLQSTIFTSI